VLEVAERHTSGSAGDNTGAEVVQLEVESERHVGDEDAGVTDSGGNQEVVGELDEAPRARALEHVERLLEGSEFAIGHSIDSVSADDRDTISVVNICQFGVGFTQFGKVIACLLGQDDAGSIVKASEHRHNLRRRKLGKISDDVLRVRLVDEVGDSCGTCGGGDGSHLGFPSGGVFLIRIIHENSFGYKYKFSCF